MDERYTSWEEAEFAEQRRKNAELKKQMMAKKGLIDPKQQNKKSSGTVVSVVNEEGIEPIIEELRRRFINQGKEMSGDPSVRAMQQFMRYTDRELSKKNIAGGSIFTETNRIKYADTLKKVYDSVAKMREPVLYIAGILRSTKKFDNQHLESLARYLKDLCKEAPSAIHEIIHHPAVIDALQHHVPFWVGGSDKGGGHNVGFKNVLKQFEKDLMNGVYQRLINKIEDFVKNGKDPFSYHIRENKQTISSNQLKQMIKESIMKQLNEGTTDNEAIDKWYQVQEAIGAEQMLDCIFNWSSSDQIDQWLQWFEEEEYISFDDDEEEY